MHPVDWDMIDPRQFTNETLAIGAPLMLVSILLAMESDLEPDIKEEIDLNLSNACKHRAVTLIAAPTSY